MSDLTELDDPEYLIVGGGLAGLYSAYRLEQAGRTFAVLEAASTVGGRIDTARAPEPHASVLDVGPTWFWPHQARMQSLLQELGLSYYPQHTAGDVLYQMAEAGEPVRHAGAGAMYSYRVAGGMTALIGSLREKVAPKRLCLDTEVTGAEWEGGNWCLSIRHKGEVGALSARNLVIAIPPRQVLRGLEPQSWASTELQSALGRQQTWMAAQAKFVAAYAEPFWRGNGLSGDAFSRTGPLVEIHDATDESVGTAALFGFVGVPALQRAQIGPDTLSDACLKQLMALFGEPASSPIYVALKDWSGEPFIATQQDREEAPAHAEFPFESFRCELDSLSVHLAGSEYATVEPGYLEGALEASERWLTSEGIGNAD